MATLTEVSEFIDEVLRLDLDTQVIGYNGTEIGPANEQAQVLANRTKWLKERLNALSEALAGIQGKEYVASVNSKTGMVTLTYTDVDAAKVEHTHSPSEIKTDDAAQFVSLTEKKSWDGKQDKLINGETLKTVLGLNLLGAGDIVIKSGEITTDDNAQFVSTEEKTKWNSKQDKLVSGSNISTLHEKSLLSGKDIKLTYNDVGADKTGSASDAVTQHIAEADPHQQYLTEERAKTFLLTKDAGNKANGYLQLDDYGKIPADFVEIFQSRYFIADSIEDRLSITEGGDITICFQLDNNMVYYLNAFEDPTVDGNWLHGRTMQPNEIFSVFGRSGVVVAQTGDYTADQITETDSRVFVTPTNKNTWDAKQDTLVSGTSIKTVNKVTLLGSGDIEITPTSIGAAETEHTHKSFEIETDNSAQFVSAEEKNIWSAKQDKLVSGSNIKTLNEKDLTGKGNVNLTYTDIGAAPAEHTHSPSEIETDDAAQFVSTEEKTKWNSKQDKLTSGTTLSTVFGKDLLSGNNVTIEDASDIGKTVNSKLIPGENIAITLNEEEDKITISSNIKITTSIKEHLVDNAIANKRYYFKGERDNFDFVAYSLEKIIASESYIGSLDYDNPPNEVVTNTLPVFDKTGYIPDDIGSVTYQMSAVNSDYESYATEEIPEPPEGTLFFGIDLGGSGKGIVPPMTSNTNGNFTVFASEYQEGYEAWKSFQYNETLTKLEANDYWRSPNAFASEELLPSIGAKSTEAFTIDSFGLQDFTSYANSEYSTSTYPTEIWLQGRDTDNGGWTTLDKWGSFNIVNTGNGWNMFALSKQYTYKQYQLLIRGAASTSKHVSISRLQFFNGVGGLIKSADGNYFTVDENNKLVQVVPSSTMFKENNFGETATPLAVSDLKALFPIQICSNGTTKVVTTSYINSSQIAINFPLDSTLPWAVLIDFKIDEVYNESDRDLMRCAVTIDGSEFFILKNEEWKSIGVLTADLTSAKTLAEQGMDIAEFEAVTPEEWKVFLVDSDTDYGVGLAYGISITNDNDKLTPKSLEFEFDDYIYWRKMTDGEVEVQIQDDRIVFKPGINGNYKFCYKFN